MEHIVQFAIGIDDEAIKKNIAEHAEKTITERLFKDIEQIIYKANSWNGELDKCLPSNYVERKFDRFLEDNREDILEIAGKYLADKLVRTKRGKELLENLTDSEHD